MREAALDVLAARLVARSPVQLRVAESEDERAAAFRLRFDAVTRLGWESAASFPARLERDADDDHAVHVVGWADGEPACTGRVVMPSAGPLPTERACGITVEPSGQVVDAGRLVVAEAWQGVAHRLLIVLLARMYVEARARGYSVGCGMMAANVRSLARQLGLRLEVLGPERIYWHELRAPVRFEAASSAGSLFERWDSADLG